MSEARLWEELCLCILSSHTRFELATEALARLKRGGLLRRLRERPSRVSYPQVEAVLRPERLPRPNVKRALPFWRMRARQLVNAARLIFGHGQPGLKNLLSHWTEAEGLRRYLVTNVPGLGMKQASSFLQSVNFSRELAVIDTRILTFLRDELMVTDVEHGRLSPVTYLELERRMQRLAAANGMEMHTLDRIVWNLGAR